MMIFLEIEYPKMNAEIDEDLKSDDSDTLAEKLYANELKFIIFYEKKKIFEDLTPGDLLLSLMTLKLFFRQIDVQTFVTKAFGIKFAYFNLR